MQTISCDKKVDTIQNPQQKGFTLIELMITLGIVAVLMAIAVPNYSDYTRRAHRADGKIALTEVANLQEKFYSDNGTYAADMAELGYPATSPDGYYTLAISMDDAATAQEYTVTATGQNGQQKDGDCKNLSMNNFGSQLPADKGCWER